MKTHRLLLAPALGAALVVAAWTAPVHAIPVVDSVNGSPNDGVICRVGYLGAMKGSAFVCSKVDTIKVDGECLDSKFPKYVTRAQGTLSGPKDICVGSDIKNLGPTDDLGNIKFSMPTAKASSITTKVGNKTHDEAVALGVSDAEVQAVTGTPVLAVSNASTDHFDVPVTYFSRPVPNGGLVVSSPFPLAK